MKTVKGWRCAVTIESCANQMFIHLRCCPTFLACSPFSSFRLLDILTRDLSYHQTFVKFLSFSLSNPLSFSHISISLYYRSFVCGFSQVDYESWKTGNPTPSGHAGTISWEWSSKEVNEWMKFPELTRARNPLAFSNDFPFYMSKTITEKLQWVPMQVPEGQEPGGCASLRNLQVSLELGMDLLVLLLMKNWVSSFHRLRGC